MSLRTALKFCNIFAGNIQKDIQGHDFFVKRTEMTSYIKIRMGENWLKWEKECTKTQSTHTELKSTQNWVKVKVGKNNTPVTWKTDWEIFLERLRVNLEIFGCQ